MLQVFKHKNLSQMQHWRLWHYFPGIDVFHNYYLHLHSWIRLAITFSSKQDYENREIVQVPLVGSSCPVNDHQDYKEDEIVGQEQVGLEELTKVTDTDHGELEIMDNEVRAYIQMQLLGTCLLDTQMRWHMLYSSFASTIWYLSV